MTPKTARVYTVDELKGKCQKALADPKLVDIVKTAPLNKNGKVNLSWVYKEAEKYVHAETKDLQKTKELAVATRFLAMLRRNFPEEFEKLISSLKTKGGRIKEEERQVNFRSKEFQLPYATEVITKEMAGMTSSKDFALRFHRLGLHGEMEVANFCLKILNDILEELKEPTCVYYQEVKAQLEKDLIQLLEEKFGLNIRICGNCKYYEKPKTSSKFLCTKSGIPVSPWNTCINGMVWGYGVPGVYKLWAPKEVSEKKEN